MKKYGWIPDLPDHRDHLFLVAKPMELPPKVDLRSGCAPVYDQGELGSCTANAIAALLEFNRIKQGLPQVTPSRLFIYYNERDMEGSVDSDSGAAIRDGIKSVVKQGAPPESEWPYQIEKFAEKPTDQAYKDALLNQAITYSRISINMQLMKSCLAQGFPFAYGFTVYQSFESDKTAKTGQVSMPHWFEHRLGGHAVAAVGYDDDKRVIIGRNSWGDGWGDHGYFYMPYEYFTSRLTADYWTIRKVETGEETA